MNNREKLANAREHLANAREHISRPHSEHSIGLDYLIEVVESLLPIDSGCPHDHYYVCPTCGMKTKLEHKK